MNTTNAAIDLPAAGASALTDYLKDCERHAIATDVGGAFAYAFRAGTALASTAAQPPAGWWRQRADEIELEVAQGKSSAMRCYTDMRALLQAAAAPKAEPADPLQQLTELSERAGLYDADFGKPAGEYPPLPAPAFRLFWDGRKGCYRVTVPGIEDVQVYTDADMRAYVDADRAMRAPAAPSNDARKLATAIAEAATRAGITDASKHSFSGPQLLMLLDDMASMIERAQAAPAAVAGPSDDVRKKIESNTWDHFGDILPTLKAISRGEWYWGANSRCKYIEIRLDTRDGGCILYDRDRVRISPEQFAFQAGGGVGKMEPWPAKNALAAAPATQAAPQPATQQGAPFGVIDPDYATAYTKARIAAWQHGYAIALQGSFTRDLDLVAIPWADSASDSETLVAAIEYRTGLKRQGAPSEKPHGRKAWSLLFPAFEDPRWIDISVVPRAALAAQPQEAAPAAQGDALAACRAACDRIIEQYDGVTAGIDWHALRSGIDRAIAAQHQKKAPVARDVLTEIIGCIDAANAEGLDDALVNNTDARLADLVQRRLLPAFYVAIKAQQAAPVAQGDAEQRQMDAKHAAIYRWMLSNFADAWNIIDNWRNDAEAGTDELHDALAARSQAKEEDAA